jgi:hypothetical protein
MLDWPECVKFGDQPRHSTTRRALVFRTEGPPEPGKKVKAVNRLVEALPGVLA